MVIYSIAFVELLVIHLLPNPKEMGGPLTVYLFICVCVASLSVRRRLTWLGGLGTFDPSLSHGLEPPLPFPPRSPCQ